MTASSHERDIDPRLAIPEASRGDGVREFVEAVANLDPTGALGAVAAVFNIFFPTELDKRSQEFQAALVSSIQGHGVRLNDIDDRLALAAYSTGVLAATRSTSEEHLAHLASATAHSIINPDDVARDHCILILRLVGDLSATHVRLLRAFADPVGAAEQSGASFEWTHDADGQFPREQIFTADPALNSEIDVAGYIADDLLRFGLIYGGANFARIFQNNLTIDGGSAGPPTVDLENPPHGATALGSQVLTFLND